MRKPSGLLVLASSALALAFVLRVGLADARVEGESEYSKGQTYNGALRYLRVDQGYEIVEKDPESAYILFRYEPPGGREQTTHGAVEIIESNRQVKVFVQLPKMPTYHETVLRDGLLKKLRTEYGKPPAKKRPPPPPKDAGPG
jgi:hypothetical protein